MDYHTARESTLELEENSERAQDRQKHGLEEIPASPPIRNSFESKTIQQHPNLRQVPRASPAIPCKCQARISEKKWTEARQWAGGRISKTKYRMPKRRRPDDWVAGSTEALASRHYQPKTGHARTGQYLHWAKARPTAQCWWCRCPSQTRDHLFKVCPEWKMQQKILWVEVLKETKRWKSRWTVRDLLADGRCGRAVLDFLS